MDLMYCRDSEEPNSWPFESLKERAGGVGGGGKWGLGCLGGFVWNVFSWLVGWLVGFLEVLGFQEDGGESQ